MMAHMTLISPDNDFALMAALFVIAGMAFLAEKTRIGSHLTGAVIAILAAIAAANLKLIPHSAPAFDFVFGYFVPVLIPLFLFKANLRHMLFETTRMTLAFLVASLGTVIGVIVAVGLLDLGSLAPAADIDPALREAGIAGLFASTYIGGSVNYAALGDITGLRTDASFFSAATATDNLFSAVFLSVLALLPGWNWLARRFTRHEHGAEQTETEPGERITAASITLAMATSYGEILFLAMPVLYATYSIFTAMRGVANPNMALILMALSSVLNMALDPLLMFGYLGLPALGLEGAAYATTISFYVTFAVGLGLFYGGRTNVRLRLVGREKVGLQSMVKMVRIGITAFLSDLSFFGARAVITRRTEWPKFSQMRKRTRSLAVTSSRRAQAI